MIDLSLLNGMRFNRDRRDGADLVKSLTTKLNRGKYFLDGVMEGATVVSDCTLSYASAAFEPRTVALQMSYNMAKPKDHNSKWGLFQTSIIEWQSLFQPNPLLGVPAITSLLIDEHNVIAPWMASVEEEVFFPIMRLAQIWDVVMARKIPSALASRIVELWCYSKLEAIDAIQLTKTAAANDEDMQALTEALSASAIAELRANVPAVVVRQFKNDISW